MRGLAGRRGVRRPRGGGETGGFAHRQRLASGGGGCVSGGWRGGRGGGGGGAGGFGGPGGVGLGGGGLRVWWVSRWSWGGRAGGTGGVWFIIPLVISALGFVAAGCAAKIGWFFPSATDWVTE